MAAKVKLFYSPLPLSDPISYIEAELGAKAIREGCLSSKLDGRKVLDFKDGPTIDFG